jgi:WD40 repeat protein
MIGTILKSRYRIIQQLGQGGFGETYIAEDLDLPMDPKPRCVVKRLQPAVIEPEIIRLFEQEAKILYHLGENHEQIPNLKAYFQENNEFYLIQSLIIGHDLSKEITQGKLCQEGYVIKFLKDVLNVLSYVHDNHVIHRDIKPQNIIRQKADGKLFLIDFGAVKQVKQQTVLKSGLTSKTVAIGTPGYMPSEQAVGKPKFSSDVYALGMTAIQALTGKLPTELSEDHDDEIVWRNLVNVSDNLADILTKMVRFKASERYRNAGEVLEVLNQVFPDSSTIQNQAVIAPIQPSLKNYFILPELEQQGMARRWGRGEINTVIPVNLDLVIVCTGGGAGLFNTNTGEAIWEIDCPARFGAVSFDGKILALGNHNIYLWDLTSRKLLRQISGYTRDVNNVAISNDNRWLVSESYNHRVRLWDVAIGEEIRQFVPDNFFCNRVAISNDCSLIVTGISTRVKLWNLDTGEEIRQFSGHTSDVNCLAISNDKRWLVSGSKKHIYITNDKREIVAGENNTIRLWEVETGREIRVFSGHKYSVESVAISNDNRWIISKGSDHPYYNYSVVKLWDIATGKQIREFSDHTTSFQSVAISHNNQWIVYGSNDNTVKLWDIATGQQLRQFSLYKDYTDYMYVIAISNDCRWIVSFCLGGTIKLWELATGQEIKQFPIIGLTYHVFSVAISNDCHWIVFGSEDHTITLWDVVTDKRVRQFSGHTNSVISLAISNDNKWLVSGSEDKTVRLWELSTGKEIRQFFGHTSNVNSVAISDDNKWIVSSSDDQTMRLWDVATSEEIRQFSLIDMGEEAYSLAIYSVAISHDHQWIVSGDDNGVVRLWDVATGEEIRQFSGHTDSVINVAISHDNRTIVSAGGDRVVRLWRV